MFLGAAPGVGKTYAMLQRARLLREEGVDVVVGLVETHSRAETEALTRGLEILPRKQGALAGPRDRGIRPRRRACAAGPS